MKREALEDVAGILLKQVLRSLFVLRIVQMVRIGNLM